MNSLISWFWNLSKSGKGVVALFYLVALGGSLGIAFVSYSDKQSRSLASAGQTEQQVPQTLAAATDADVQIVMKFNEEMPFKKTKVEDPSLTKGTSYVRTIGVNGRRDVTYEVTYLDGVETGRIVLSKKVLKKPVDEVTVVGTKAAELTPQVQGAQVEKSDAETSDTSASEEAQPTPKARLYIKAKICVTEDDDKYLSWERRKHEDFSSLDKCREALASL